MLSCAWDELTDGPDLPDGPALTVRVLVGEIDLLELTAALTERTAALDRAYREREDAILRYAPMAFFGRACRIGSCAGAPVRCACTLQIAAAQDAADCGRGAAAPARR